MKNYYEILGVDINSSQEVIELTYKSLLAQYHSDNKSNFTEKNFKDITEAYYVLSDPNLRSEYNLKLGIGPDILKQYNNLYAENQKLKREIETQNYNNTSKGFFKKKKKNRMFNTSLFKDLPSLKDLLKIIGTSLYNETKKPKEERSKDLLAIFITLIIVGLIVFAFIKFPILSKIVFPGL